VAIRNDLTAAGSSTGYAVVVVTPARLVSFQWDADADGYLDTYTNSGTIPTGAVWVRLVRSGSQLSGWYSMDGITYTQVGSAVTLASLGSAQDGGIISTSHDVNAAAANLVSNLQFVTGVDAAYRTYGSASALITQTGSAAFTAGAAGADMWGAGGQTDDAYAAIYKVNAVGSSGQVTAQVRVQDANAWAKSGVALRNDFARPGSSAGYAAMVVTPGNGVALQWDSNGDGYLDSSTAASVATNQPVWVRLTRSGSTITGSYSLNGTTYTTVGTATLSGAESSLDGGVVTTAHVATAYAGNLFSSVAIG
jgi:regulation of enolase protein 1 (concanavalin A-like superfamily)